VVNQQVVLELEDLEVEVEEHNVNSPYGGNTIGGLVEQVKLFIDFYE
jgi:hypothetical protein